MNSITELDNNVLDLVSGGATPYASTVSIAADGSVTGSYKFGDRSGTFATTLSIPVYKAGTVSISSETGFSTTFTA
jgi:hypothetical protein